MSRTVVDLDDKLLKRAQKLSGLTKKVEIVNTALKEFVETRDIRKAILELKGRVRWEGNLKEMRKDRKIDFGG